MLKRPKPGENEDDILRMQEEFLREKNKNQNFQSAAQVVNLRPTVKQTPKASTSEPGKRKPSKYAQSKGLQNTSEKRLRTHRNNSVMGDILEKNPDDQSHKEPELEDDKVYYPKVMPFVLGNIVEKNVDVFVDFSDKPMPSQGFPVVTKYDPSIPLKRVLGRSLTKDKDKPMKMDIDDPSSANVNNHSKKVNITLPSKSYLVSSKDADEIHKENIKVLSEMSEKEILEEQQKLLSNLDPKLIEFIKRKRNQVKSVTEINPDLDKAAKEDMDTQDTLTDNWSLWENDVLSHPNVNEWLNFESLEKDKLEWLKGIEESKKVKADEPYEARFNFKGYLMPYTIEYTEQTKTLFHHGEEENRPGYSLTELFELSRSTIIQQRVMALNTIAGILEYYTAGTYKDVLKLPLSKIFFVIRFAVDENKVIILEATLKALRNLLYNRIDEASLDALLGFEEGLQQPSLENDKSEIGEIESQESELIDFHLAEIDIITALLRTDILQRIYYILENIKPSFNCVHYSLQILTRLVRDSVATATKIVETEHLMNTILKYFVPAKSITFAFEPQIAYNDKPILAALKFLRVLSLQSYEIGEILVSKYDILNPISEYISSGVDGTYGLRIQIEAICILANLVHYRNAVNAAISLCPVIINTLYKHIHGTDIFINSSILSVTHAAVLVQLMCKILNCNMFNIDNIKHQIYPLIKQGVQKWLAQLAQSDSFTCGHLRLVCSALDCCKSILEVERLPLKFLTDSLLLLTESQGFKIILNQLPSSSNLLSGLEKKDLHLINNLISLGCSVIDSAHKVLPILNVNSPLPFLASLFQLLNLVDDKKLAEVFIGKVFSYLNKITSKAPNLCDNWFSRIETDFIFSVVKLSIQIDISESQKDELYAVANKLCYILRVDKKYELDFLFTNIVFNKQWFTAARLLNLVSLSDADGFSRSLTSIEDIRLCYSKVINLTYIDTGPNIVLKKWQEPILPRDWIYLPILNLYSKSQEADMGSKVVGDHANRIAAKLAAEKELIITCSLEWILFNELCFPDLLNDIDVTDRFCRIMCVYLCDNSLFLDKKIKILLAKCTETLFKKKAGFNFDKQLTGLNNFQDFYTQFLEQFQAVSYGDTTFAACVLVPLAQKHNVKWRKLLWSEYAGCLRALDCPEDQLCYYLNDYLYPEETDKSLIDSYFQALTTNLLRPGTIAYQIANHHVQSFKNRRF